MNERKLGYWAIQGPGWALVLYLVYAQGIPAFDYQLGVRMGVQESAASVTELGITIYWPIVCLATVVAAHGLEGWHLANENIYWVVLPAISLWGIFGLWQLNIEMKRRMA